MNTEILNQFKHACDIFADVIENDAEYSDAVRDHSTVKENLKPLLEADEEFRYIAGYPNYVVTSLGKIINIKTLKVLKPGETYVSGRKQGKYKTYFINLCTNGKKKKFYVHQLVANAFLDKPAGKDLVVNHIDHDTSNNRVTNLEWISRSKNAGDQITNRWTNYSIEELIDMRKAYKAKSREYERLNTTICYRRKKIKDGTQSN